MLYRVKQFIWAITAPFKEVNKDILNKYLDKEEKKLFDELTLSDKHHSIRVCEDVIKESESYNNIDKDKLAKIALLHDIGKSKYNLNVIDKSVLVLADKFTKGKIRENKENKKVYSYYYHPKISKDMLNKSKYDREFIDAIENHHYSNENDNIYLKIIKKSDDRS